MNCDREHSICWPRRNTLSVLQAWTPSLVALSFAVWFFLIPKVVEGHLTIEGLPPAYHVAATPSVEPQPGDPMTSERLHVAEQNKVLHSVNLDKSPEHWADRLLCISVGFQEDWTPVDFYALFPQGYKDREKEATAFLDTIMVRFGQLYRPEGGPLHSVNRLGYTLSQEGEYLVVSRRDRERWYFESPDGGSRWRLAKIGWIKHPGQFTTLEYTNDQITALRFPNGAAAKITYDGDLPNRIETPWGETTVIERQVGLVTKIAIHRQLANGALSKPLKTFAYEYDGDRKIKRFVNSFGTAFDVTYSRHDTTEHGLECNIFEAIIRNTVDGSFEYHRHMNAAKEWEFQTRWGTAKDTPQTAPLTSMVRRKAEFHRWDKVSEAKGSEIREVNYERDDQTGYPTAVVDAEGRTRLVNYDSQGRPTREVSPDGGKATTQYNDQGLRTRAVDAQGRERIWEYDESSRPIRYVNWFGCLTTYAYDERGYCTQSVVDGQVWRYRFDEWGRLAEAKGSNGNVTQWTFDQYGQLIAMTQFRAGQVLAPGDAGDGSHTDAALSQEGEPSGAGAVPSSGASQWTRYEYDDYGRVTAIRRSNGEKELFQYYPTPHGRLAAHVRVDGIRVTYTYDEMGRLREMRDPTKQVAEYWYHPSGTLRMSRIAAKGEPPVLSRFNHVGELLSKTVVGQGEIRYVYDKAGNLVEEDKPPSATAAPSRP